MTLNEIFTFENLYKSHKECRRSKQHKGEVIRFEINLAFNINNIIKEILNKNYKIGKYKKFTIYDPKERIIEALPYKDRVVLLCFCRQVLIPRIDKRLIYDNVACRKGKGTEFGRVRLDQFLLREYLKEKNNNFYYLKCDIKKYFPSIDHKILLEKLKRIGFNSDELWLIKMFIKSNYSSDVGLPLGNLSSQWFALFYLDSVDRLIKEVLQIKSYVRYMDDIILIHRDKAYLQHCKEEIRIHCKEYLKLSLNQKTQIGKISNGIDFLGFKHSLMPSGKIIRKLRGSSKVRMKRHLKTLKVLYEKELVDDEYVYIRKNAFFAHIKNSNESVNFKNKVKPK